MKYLAPIILIALIGCIQLSATKLSTFGSAEITIDLNDTGQPKKIVAKSDGTNIFRIFHDAIAAVRGVFGGGQDAPEIHINIPTPLLDPQAEPEEDGVTT